MISGRLAVSTISGGKATCVCSSSRRKIQSLALVKMSLTSSFGRRSAGFRYVVPSAVLNAIVEMKLEDLGGSFLLLASSMYGAKPAAIALRVWSWRQLYLPFWSE